ncbi:TPA: hypothetical protein RPO84_004350 [Escherichia coli]|nr:hypothetical protein [Escherichia coli]
MLGQHFPRSEQTIIERLQKGPATYEELEEYFESAGVEIYSHGYDTLRWSVLQLMDPSMVDCGETTIIFDGKHLSLLAGE